MFPLESQHKSLHANDSHCTVHIAIAIQAASFQDTTKQSIFLLLSNDFPPPLKLSNHVLRICLSFHYIKCRHAFHSINPIHTARDSNKEEARKKSFHCCLSSFSDLMFILSANFPFTKQEKLSFSFSVDANAAANNK